MIEKFKEIFGNKKKEEPRIVYHLIKIVGPNKIKLEATREPPKGIPLKYAVEIEDAYGNKGIGFLVVEHNLEPLVDVPVVKMYLEKHKYIPIDVKDVFEYKVEELKQEVYEAFEIALAGKWAKIVYEKGYGFKITENLGLIGKIILLAFIIIGLILGFTWLFPNLFKGGGGEQVKTQETQIQKQQIK